MKLWRGLRLIFFCFGAVVASLGFLSSDWYRTMSGRGVGLSWGVLLTVVVFGVATAGLIGHESRTVGMVLTFTLWAVAIYLGWDIGVSLSGEDIGVPLSGDVVAFGYGSILGFTGLQVLQVVSILLWADDGQ